MPSKQSKSSKVSMKSRITRLSTMTSDMLLARLSLNGESKWLPINSVRKDWIPFL